MITRQNVLSTIRMVREENLDVRAVTLGINLNICANPDPEALVKAVYNRIIDNLRQSRSGCARTSGLSPHHRQSPEPGPLLR